MTSTKEISKEISEKIRMEELDSIARQYHMSDQVEDKFIEDACQKYALKWILSQLHSQGTILEMGYGDGVVTSYLVQAGYSLTLLEGSALLVEQAKTIYGSKIDYCLDLFEMFKPTQLFDHVIASHVLEHVTDPVSLLIRIKSWLKPHGKLIVIVPNSESLHRQLAVLMGIQKELTTLSPRDHLVGHKRVYSFETLHADLAQAGFEIESSTGFFLKTLPNSMMVKFSLELLHALNEITPRIPKNLLANIGMVGHVQHC